MKKPEIIGKISDNTGVSKKDVKLVLENFFVTMKKETKLNEPFNYTPYIKAEIIAKKARKGRNPYSGEEIKIPAKKVFKLKATKTLKEM